LRLGAKPLRCLTRRRKGAKQIVAFAPFASFIIAEMAPFV
jgi:hypothetical protein